MEYLLIEPIHLLYLNNAITTPPAEANSIEPIHLLYLNVCVSDVFLEIRED